MHDDFKIPLCAMLPSKVSPNYISAQRKRQLVSGAISQLLANRCVEPLFCQREVVNPLSVSVQASGRKDLHWI